ncbi:MAG: LCP family protein [Actinobacteria bacterium]|nr:LCP family protein [Actinomycetota bacterium]
MRRRREVQRSSRRTFSRYFGIAVLVLTVLASGAGYYLGSQTSTPRTKAAKGAPVATQETWLMIGTKVGDSSLDADWLSVLSYDRKAKRGFMMYLPRTTYVEIPGHGLETLNKALSLGHEPLIESSTANLLGIAFDHYVTVSDQSLQAFFERVGTLTVDVPQRLTTTGPDARSREVFAEGKQPMNGQRVAQYLTFQSPNGDEISRATRHASVWQTFFDHYRGHRRELTDLIKGSKDLFVPDPGADVPTGLFAALSEVEQSSFSFETLPVEATGVSAGTQLYSPDHEAIETTVKTYLAGSRPLGSSKSGRRIEILNGNGQPGLGAEVSQLLIPKGFRVILDQNAKSFDYDATQIVVYSSSKTAMAVAQEVRSALGVGEIIVSKQQQSVVDVTVVVGKDYLKKKG